MEKNFMMKIIVKDIPNDAKKLKICFTSLSYTCGESLNKTLTLELDIVDSEDLGEIN